MKEVLKQISNLVERFEQNIEAYHSPAYNETQLRREFTDPYFEALGWDIANKEGHESEGYHLHIHLIPRSKKLGQKNPSEKAAWKIYTLAPSWDGFPGEYRLRTKESKENDIVEHKEEVVALMTYLKGCLKARGTSIKL